MRGLLDHAVDLKGSVDLKGEIYTTLFIWEPLLWRWYVEPWDQVSKARERVRLRKEDV